MREPVKEHPVLFSTSMVQAILAGRKMQTRRVVKPQPAMLCRYEINGAGTHALHLGPPLKPGDAMSFVPPTPRSKDHRLPCPHGVPGDRLWVREAFTHITGNGIRVHYRADGEPTDNEGRVLPTEPGLRRWWPSIHMSRKISRIMLEITTLRVERLQDIDELDALAEGVEGRSIESVLDGKRGEYVVGSARDAFAALWDEINGKPRPMLDVDGEPVLDDAERPIMIAPQSWATNPYVWIVEFKVLDVKVKVSP
jgi:hypothetical protein